MTQDDIIRMAREAGFEGLLDKAWGIEQLERFAALVAANEREACAKVCEEMHEPDESDYHWIPDGRGALKSATAAIRARGDK